MSEMALSAEYLGFKGFFSGCTVSPKACSFRENPYKVNGNDLAHFCQYMFLANVSNLSKKEGKDQELIQSSTTPDPRYQWENDNVTIRHHKREPRGQPFPSR